MLLIFIATPSLMLARCVCARNVFALPSLSLNVRRIVIASYQSSTHVSASLSCCQFRIVVLASLIAASHRRIIVAHVPSSHHHVIVVSTDV
jgi:hypothetical protein